MATAVTPWWQTGWVALPILTLSGLAGAAVGAWRHATRPPVPPELCPGLRDDGGVLEGVEYEERRSGGAKANETLPMVIVLHGANMSAAHVAELATAIPIKARIIAPAGWYGVPGQGSQWRDPTGQVPLDEDAGALANFLEQVRRCRHTVGKPVVAGYDQGADVAYILAVDDPGLVAAVVGAGGVPPSRRVQAPTVVLHGIKDQVVPFGPAREAWHQQVADGAPVRFLSMFGVDHSFAGALQIKLWQEVSELLADPASAPKPTT